MPGKSTVGAIAGNSSPPIALVYRDDQHDDGCADALASLLRNSKWGFDVRFVGPREKLKLTADTLRAAALYAQPGGNGSLDDTWSKLRHSADIIRDYAGAGGRYLGICMGAYLAGTAPGYHLIPGDSDQYITSAGATVTSDADGLVEVFWRGRPRYMFFQDGPCFDIDEHVAGVTVLATYPNGKAAALVATCGRGRVAVCGPHPEADAQWYSHYNLSDPDGPDADLGYDLIDTLMK